MAGRGGKLAIDGVAVAGEKKRIPRKQSQSVLERTWKSSLRGANATPVKSTPVRAKERPSQRKPRRDPECKPEPAEKDEPKDEPEPEIIHSAGDQAEKKDESERGGFFKFTDTDAKGVKALTGVHIEEDYEEEDFEEESQAEFEEDLEDQLEKALARQDSAPALGSESDDASEEDDFEAYEEEAFAEMRERTLQLAQKTPMELTAGIEEDIVDGYGTAPLWKTSNKALEFKFTDTNVKRRTRNVKLAQQ
jgi:hypothetical protein